MITEICAECGHTKSCHVEKFGGICVGCPCSGFKPIPDKEEVWITEPGPGFEEAVKKAKFEGIRQK